jgi:DNA primase
LEEGMNVKVLLLPDKEDPDSFAKKMGASGYLNYIKENETDFIQFKTRLLLKSTENDPVAKARLISDVIRSVAVIPDTITRSVYIKECSKLLDVNEEVLYTEVQKQKRKQSDDFKANGIREQTRKAARQPEIQKEVEVSQFLEEELVFLRFLLKFSRFPLFELEGETPGETELISVGEFMITELEKDDLISQNELFRIIFTDVKENLENTDFDPWKHFVYHSNSEISALATDLLSEKFIESNIWKRGGGFTEREEDILDLLVPKIINEYKARKIRLMLPAIEDEINRAYLENDFDRVIDEQSKYMNLKRVEKDLSEKLGNRAMN